MPGPFMNDEQSIFLTALEQATPAQRSAYLDQACGGDAVLRRRIEALLNQHEHAGSFLENPAQDLAETDQFSADTSAKQPGDHASQASRFQQDATSLNFLTITDQPGCLGTLGPYVVRSVLGRGGMGIVLEAEDPKLRRLVAMKVLTPELAEQAAAKKRFLREARAAAAVISPWVVTVHAVEEQPTPYLVMELVNGRTLRQKIDTQGMLETKEVLRIGAQIAHGLAAAHAQGLIHRDVKPENILLENGVERVKITDFGLARPEDDTSITRAGEIAGTPQFMSPEQARGEMLDSRSDLFSMGCVLYAMCTGGSPFRGDNPLSVLRRVVEDTCEPIRGINPDIPAWLCQIIDKLLAKNPADRYPTAAEVAALLEERLAELQQPAPSLGVQATRIRSPRTWAAIAAAGALLLAIVLGLGNSRNTDPAGGSTSDHSGQPQQLLTDEAPQRPAVQAVAFDGINRGLYFGGDVAGVTLPKLELDERGPFTVELRTACFAAPQAPCRLLVLGGLKLQIGKAPEGTRWVVIVHDPNVEPAWKVASYLFSDWPSGSETPGWTHLALVRNGGLLRLFVNGCLIVQEPYAGDFDLQSLRQIGESGFDGMIDEVRISSTARYERDFVPPPLHQRFKPDKHTVALYHFDQPQGDVAQDASGNGFHGTIVGSERIETAVALRKAGIDASPAPELPPTLSSDEGNGPNLALQFDANPAGVSLGRLLMDEQPPYTIELQVTCLSPQDEQVFLLFLGCLQLKITATPIGTAWHALVRDINSSPPRSGVITELSHPWDAGENMPGPTHLALVREKNLLRLFVNGRLVAHKLYSDPIELHSFRTIGYRNFDATIDEVRISNTARYTEDFTPPSPTDRFRPDQHTVALYHFDEGSGRFALDASGNGFHGVISGGKWIPVENLLERDRQAPP